MRQSRRGVFHVFLVRPSKYDDEGFVIRHWRSVVPSNSLACLYGLTQDASEQQLLGNVDVRIHMVDEAVTKIPMKQISRLHQRAGNRVLVCLAGVQSNQFCRASDIAVALRRLGVDVMIGGFHVSGMLAMFPGLSPEIQELVDAGVTVVAGEVEYRWADLLRDACEHRLKPVYRFLDDPPDLSHAPLPAFNKQYRRNFVYSHYGTIDCSRGCPFSCSFCTIINVQGRKSRYRSPECVAETIRRACRESGTSLYFFTDDNFARNPAWEEILDALIGLREQEGASLQFIMQVDVPAYRIPRFVDKAARAGCCSVFIGMESLNPANLQDTGKTQNRAQEYSAVIAAWRNARVRAQIGYIIGFPNDTEQSVSGDVDRLIREVQPEQATFFMMVPLPGSRDHQRMVERGVPLDPDYNTYDSCHESMPHPHMKDGAWTRAYRSAWRKFYSFENMKAILNRTDPATYWDVFKNLYWYKSALAVENAHPMLTGFFRLKDRATRRPSFPRESRFAHARRRLSEISRFLRDALRVTLEMEELWLETRKRSDAESRVLDELARIRTELHRGLRVSELQAAYIRVKAQIPSIEVPSRLSLLWESVSLFRVGRLRRTRRDLAAFWTGLRWRPGHGRIAVLLRPDRILLNALREIQLASGFLAALMIAEE